MLMGMSEWLERRELGHAQPIADGNVGKILQGR